MTSSAAIRGLAAGVVGVAAMTIGEMVEQVFTKRPNSFVPGHTLERFLGPPQKPDQQRLWMNWTMHWGQAFCLVLCAG